MNTTQVTRRRADAAEQFNRHEDRDDGTRVATSLADGLTILRDVLYQRVHHDVQRNVGTDSMLAPLSEEQTRRLTKAEIELYQIAVSATTARERGYVGADDDWFLQWLTRLRLGNARAGSKAAKRLDWYMSQTPQQRRLTFTDVLASALPESRKAPLVLFRLVTPAVEIVTALAFGDEAGAREARDRQADCLPGIRHCPACRGAVLENGERCDQCGNPLWEFDRLTAAD